MKPFFIALEGAIGVGKTTLAQRLQVALNCELLLEVFEENPFLPHFYRDRDRYAFQTQIFFLLSRYHQQHQAVPQALARGPLISDYTFGKDEIFAWLNLKDDELAMYGRVHAALGERLVRPDLIVYLTAEHESLMRRIALRDRPYERNMDPHYIHEVSRAYDAWLARMNEPQVLKIDTTHLDFLARDDDLNYIVELVRTTLDRQRQTQPPQAALPHAAPTNGDLAVLQSLQRRLKAEAEFAPDLFHDYLHLADEVGELAGGLRRMWQERQRLAGDGRSLEDAHNAALSARREILEEEMAGVLSALLQLANDAGIDLAHAYQRLLSGERAGR